MKRWIGIIYLCLATTWGFAQKKSSFGIYTGYGGYIIHGKSDDGEFWLRPEESIVLGTDFEFPIAKKVYLQPALMYIQKGANFDRYDYLGTLFKGDVKLSYLVVPMTIVFKPELGNGQLIVGAGPYLGLGLGREAGVEQGIFNIRFETDVSRDDMGEDPFYFSPWDAGGNFILGFQFRNDLFVQFQGQVGMKRINPSVNGKFEKNAKHKNLGLGLIFGFRF